MFVVLFTACAAICTLICIIAVMQLTCWSLSRRTCWQEGVSRAKLMGAGFFLQSFFFLKGFSYFVPDGDLVFSHKSFLLNKCASEIIHQPNDGRDRVPGDVDRHTRVCVGGGLVVDNLTLEHYCVPAYSYRPDLCGVCTQSSMHSFTNSTHTQVYPDCVDLCIHGHHSVPI